LTRREGRILALAGVQEALALFGEVAAGAINARFEDSGALHYGLCELRDLIGGASSNGRAGRGRGGGGGLGGGEGN
jgi:hypothetical protein